MSMIDTYNQLLAKRDMQISDEEWLKLNERAIGVALVCQQVSQRMMVSNSKTNEKILEELEAVVEKAKQQGHLK